MALSLDELLAPITKSEAYQTFLQLLAALEFPVTAWQSTNAGVSISDAIAELYSGARDTIPLIASGGYLDLAEGEWLDLLVSSQFADENGVALVRKPAVYTQLNATLIAAAGSGPHVIAAGQLTAQDGQGHRFRNVNADTVPLGGFQTFLWQAETAGSAWNIGDNTLTQLVTPLAGVSINNAGPGSIVVVGADAERDSEYRARARVQWAVLAEQSPKDAYVAWALKADSALRKVFVDDQNPNGPGTIHIWLANDLTTAQPSQITNVETYIEPRRAISSQISYSAAPVAGVTITATVYSKAEFALTAALVEEALDEFFAELPLGGETIPALGNNLVFRDAIEFAIRDASPGVRVVDLVDPASDVALTANSLAVPNYAITVVQI